MKKCFAILTIFSLVVSLFYSQMYTSNTAYANDSDRGVITASSLNVRENPNTTAKIIGSLTRNTEVELHEKVGTWYKIQLNNRWGYIHSDFVQVKKSAGSTSPNNSVIAKGEVTTTRLNVREKANTSSSIISTLQRGAKVDLFEKSGQWYKMKVGNGWGYIHSDYLKVSQIAQNDGNTNPTTNGQVIGKGEITATKLNIREKNNTSAKIVGSLLKGNKVDIYEKSGQWYKVKVGNTWGFIHVDYVKFSEVSQNTESGNNDSGSNTNPVTSNPVTGKGEITATRLNVRDKANTSGKIIGSLQSGNKVDLYEKSGQWHKIKVGNSWGYIHSDYVKVTQATPNETTNPTPNAKEEIIGKGEITATRLNVREKNTSTAKIVDTVDRGAKVDLYEKIGDWYKIKQGSQWGYIHGTYVKITNTQSTKPSTNINLSGKKIFLDPGHGGRDPGAVISNVKESDVALSISNLLKQKLEAAGATVVTSRTNDVFLSLSERVTKANQSNADIFISIHMNAWTGTAASGVEMFYDRANAGNNSKKLADTLQKQMVENFSLRDRGVRERNLEVVRYTKMPAVLAELGFMTNSDDLTILLNEQEKISNVLLEGINRYFQ